MTDSVVALFDKTKYPTEVLTYGMSFVNVLQSGETLSAVSSVVEPTSTLTITSPAVTSGTTFDDEGNAIPPGEAITFQVSGGVDATDYRIIATTSTSSGNTRVGVGVLHVRNGNLF